MQPAGRVALLVVTAMAAVVTGCGPKGNVTIPSAESPATCRGLVDSSGRKMSEALRWHHPEDADEQQQLLAWCNTVGPGVLAPARAAHGSLDGDIVVVSWNVHVGGGQLTTFVRELRRGRFTGGTRPAGFVLLLQEAFRRGPPVPQSVDADAPVPDRIGAASSSAGRDDVVAVAEAEGLSLLYLPSMRNGRDAGAQSEDRGNAILSSLDLGDPTGVELPFVRQRRVAVAATVTVTGLEQSWRLRVVNVHLDASTGPRQLWLFASAHRGRQTRHLLDALDHDQIATVVGGDLNTWAGGTREPAFMELRREFPQVETGARFARWLTLDYLFLRLPPSWRAESGPADTAFGSDHRPILSRIRLGA
jgi:endonuclease/exonuclease/phosphatase family metal-dependent hydrolase